MPAMFHCPSPGRCTRKLLTCCMCIHLAWLETCLPARVPACLPHVQGGNEGGSFVRRFSEWLNATWPHPGHRIINQGLPAVTSALFAACYDKVNE